MTADELKAAWQQIGNQSGGVVSGPYLHLQVMGGDVAIGAVLRAADQRPGLLVRFTSDDLSKIPKASSSRGIVFERPVPAGTGRYGLPIVLADSSLVDLFAHMGADLVAEASRSDVRVAPLDRVLRRIDLWRRFLQKRGSFLSIQECHGLFAELYVLSLVIKVDGVDSALSAWLGPNRELQDFRFGDGSLEVKSWQTQSTPRVYVSRPGQLYVDLQNPLHLVVVELSGTGGHQSTLPAAIADLRAQMNELQVQQFDELLAAYGYLDLHAGEYLQPIRGVGHEVYEVREDFPYLKPQAIPGGIVDVRYALELGAIQEFRASNGHI